MHSPFPLFRLFHKYAAVISCLFLLTGNLFSQAEKTPAASATVPVDLPGLVEKLKAAPEENTPAAKSKPLTLMLPVPEGGEVAYQVEVSHIMEESDRLKYPDIKTYKVFNETGHAYGRMVISPGSLHAYIFTERGSYFIDPVDNSGSAMHRVFFQESDAHADCGFNPSEADWKRHFENQSAGAKMVGSNGSQKRTYRMAITTTGEFFQHANFGNNSLATATAKIVQIVSDVSAKWELEMAVSFTLVTLNNAAIYTNPGSDPYDPTNSNTRTDQAAMGIGMHYTTGLYDIGHLLHGMSTGSGGSGVAGLGVVCSNTAAGMGGVLKAAGWSGGETVSLLGIDIMVHEVGHMFSMTHTFNGDGNSCAGDQYPETSAYEIGSGTTIMSYNGSCGAGQNIPSGGAADDYFHTRSLEQAVNYILASGGCATTASLNTPPVVDANPGACGTSFTIPKSTPFRLTGSGSDADGDQVFYCWEQINEAANNTQGFIGAQAAGDAGAPLFRSFPPTTSTTRYFPNIELIKTESYLSDWEPLSTIARTMRFGLTGRDWKPGTGGIHGDSLDVTVSASGPFEVTAPNGGGTIAAGGNTTVTWAVNGTNAFCANVNIRLSVDGGTTYPYTLLASTPNDGSQSVTLPAGVPATTTARMMVECASNECVVFFDISDGNFTITSDCNAAGSNICPATAVSFPAGDGGLNLGLSGYFGSVVTSNTFTINGASPTGPLANATVEGGTICQTAWGTEKYATFDFAVSATGSYTFLNTSGGQIMYSVFVSAGYNPATPCAGTFIESNSWGAISWNTLATMTLNACTVYKMVVWTLSGANATPTITMSGPGVIYSAGSGPGANYSYTYAAVNTATGQVALVSATSNFTALAAGTYLIYGASYHSGAGPNPPTVNPATWVGQTLSAILSGGNCVVFSANFKLVTVTGGGGGTPVISISGSPSQNEGNAGNTAFNFTATRTGSTANASSANWAVTGSGGNPATAADFGGTFPSGTVTFPAGSSAAQTITVNVSGDTSVEPNEGFTVTLSNPTNATLGTATASGTILNDDAAPAYCTASATATTDEKISNVTFNTINNNSSSTAGYEDFTAVTTSVAQGATHNFTGTISNPFNSDEIIVWIDYNQDFDFADAGEEVFNSPNGTGPHSGNITIPAGATVGNTRMRVRLHDTANGPNATPCGTSQFGQVEDYTINITASGGTPSIAISGSPSQNEGNAGNTAFNFTVTRTGNTANASSANWAVTGSGGNPANAADFGGTLPSGTVTFPAGSSATQTITVNVSGDTDVESDEGFTVTLSNPVNATITTATASGTIVNDDASISISGSPSQNEGNAGNTAFNFTATRTGSTANASSASWAVTGSGGNPANAADFGGTLPSGTVTFPAGSSATQTITVNVSGDTGVEPNEGFTVTLSNPSNATLGTATASGTILNDDAAPAYCTAGATATTDEKISNVTFNTINNNSSSTAGYEDFTAVTTSVAQGATHNFTGTISNAFSSDEIIVWIDYNQDLDFADAGEEVFNSPNGTGPHSGNITIPVTASTGNTRMRVRLHDTANGPNATPCGTSDFGQVEDYTINITSSLPVISISGSPSQNEGNSGNTAFNFTATRTGSTANASSASWAVTGSGGNPANAADFGGTLPSGTVTFPAGSSATQTITVNVSGDTGVEPNEGFTVTLSNPSNATLGTATASGTILNDDSAGSYCAAGATSTQFEKLSNVLFNTINNPSSSTGGYEDFTAVSTSVAQGSTHSFTGTISGGFADDEIIVWIDYNQDLDFTDAGEEVFNSPTGTGPHSGNITIPVTASTGNTRMRVRLHDTVNGTPNVTPCGNSTYGQVEDYTINITVGGSAGASLDFDGTNDHVTLPANLTASLTNFTLEAWVFWDGSSNWQRVFDFGSNTTVYMALTASSANNSNRPTFSITTGSAGAEQRINSSVSATIGQWQHYAVVLDDASNTGVLYLDGVQVGSNTSLTLTPAALGNLANNYLGRSQWPSDPYFNGKLDEVRIWNYARTSQEIHCEMDETLVGNEAGLVAYYNFNQGVGNGSNPSVTTLDDLTSNNSNGTLVNFALTGTSSNWTLAASSGKVLDFVEGDYVTGTNASLPLGNTARTMELWMKSSAGSSGWEAMFDYGTFTTNQRAALYINNSTGALHFTALNSDLTGGPSIRDGNWHHCAATFDGTTLKLYVDGNEVASQAKTFNTTGTTFEMGRQIGSNGDFFDGKLDEVRVWNVARTQDQIRASKNVQLAGNEAGLVAYYSFNQGIANADNTGLTTLDDASPTNANGTLTGFALTGSSSNWSGGGAHNEASGAGCCPTVLYVGGIITTGNYQATTEVNSDGTIPAGATVLFKGATSILLGANFEVMLGAIFDTMMVGCTP